jgi:hypothetical protein
MLTLYHRHKIIRAYSAAADRVRNGKLGSVVQIFTVEYILGKVSLGKTIDLSNHESGYLRDRRLYNISLTLKFRSQFFLVIVEK